MVWRLLEDADMRHPLAFEAFLASLAVGTIATFTGCGGTTEPSSSSSGSSGASSGTSSGASSSGSIGSSSGTSGNPSNGPSSGPGTCANGKDPVCGCTLPDTKEETFAYQGPPDGGTLDSGPGRVDAAALDGGPWTCAEECDAYHWKGNAKLTTCALLPNANPTQVSCTYYLYCIGRRPAELDTPCLGSPAVAELLAGIAKLEAASVGAFTRLARELAHHRAPADLVARAREAAEDERRHARSMRALAIRYGADDVPKPKQGTRRVPGLVDVLLENAVEGCVRETFGAVMAHVQAQLATDPVARRTMAVIAIDESRHAALAWAIDAWGRARLGAAERRRVDEARQNAVLALREEIASGAREVAEAGVGLVGAREAEALVVALSAELWAKAA